MAKIVKEALILFAITLVAGILLGAVYEVTKEPIAKQNELAKQNAYKAVMSDAEKFEEIKIKRIDADADKDDDKENNEDTPAYSIELSDEFSADTVTEVVAGIKNNKIIGFVITVVASDGYAGDIKFSVGVSAEGEYLGTSILSIGETAGLGMRVKTDPKFLAQFNNKKVEKFNLVKDGTGESSDDKVDAISGSTVTSKAMTGGINAALSVYKDLMESNVKTVGGVGIE